MPNFVNEYTAVPGRATRPPVELDVHDVGDPAGRVGGRGDQVREAGPRDVQHAGHIDRDHLVPVRQVGFGGRADPHQSGVVDHGIEPTQFRHNGIHCGGRLLLIGHVGLDGQGATAGVLDAAAQLVESVAAPGQQRHRRALGGEPKCRRLTDPAAGTGDQRDRVLKS